MQEPWKAALLQQYNLYSADFYVCRFDTVVGVVHTLGKPAICNIFRSTHLPALNNYRNIVLRRVDVYSPLLVTGAGGGDVSGPSLRVLLMAGPPGSTEGGSCASSPSGFSMTSSYSGITMPLFTMML